MPDETQSCDECGSLYFRASSEMAALCPECAHMLYGYPASVHAFEAGRCRACHWDGSRSVYMDGLVGLVDTGGTGDA